MVKSPSHSYKAYNLATIPLFGLVGLATALSFFNMKSMAFYCLVLFILLLLTCVILDTPYSYFRKITNTLVCLHAFSLFLPWGASVISFSPRGPKVTIVLMGFLLVTVVLFLIPQRHTGNKTSRVFKLLVFWIIFSSIAGILSGIMGFNPIRANMPLVTQLRALGYFADAVLIYYVIVKNNWGFEEYEKLFRIVLWCGCIIFCECLITFYIGLYHNSFSISPYGNFNSMFIGRQYYTGIIGISMSFLSIYFWGKYRRHGFRYLIIIILGFLLAFSSLARNIIGSDVAGMLFFVFLAFKYTPYLKNMKRTVGILKPNFVILGLIIISAMLCLLVTELVKSRPDALSPNTIVGRGYRSARALDVFSQHYVLGTGLGIVRFYSHSSSVEPVISKYMSPFTQDYYTRNMINDPSLLRGGIHGGYKTETTHNLLLDFIVGLGLPGLFFIIYFIYRGWKIFRFMLFFSNKNTEKYQLVPVFAICAFVLSICLTQLTTSKFESYWYFAILFGFVNLIYRELKTKFVNT